MHPFAVDVEKYAVSLVKNGFYKTIKEARKEAIRYNNEAENGMCEPLMCLSDINTKIDVKSNNNGGMLYTITFSNIVSRHLLTEKFVL